MAENDKTSDKTKTSDLVEYRKKRKQRKLLTKLIVVAAVFVLALLVAANFNAIIEPLRGIASRIDTKTSDEIGFPIKLSGSASYSFDSFGDNFSLLTDTYLYTYGMNGGQNYAVRHSYSKPVQCTNSKRILLYDKDYNSFSLYNKTRLIYSNTVEDKIVFASLGGNDSAAVVTNSDRYSNIIYVYDGNGKWRYTRKYIDENVMNVQFSSEGRYIYVSTLGVENGEIYSSVYKYDITGENDAIWSYRLTRSSIPVKMFVKSGRVCVLYDNYGVSLNEADGSITGEKEFSGTVQCCDNSDSMIGVIYLDTSSNKKILLSLSYEMEVKASKAIGSSINRIVTDGGVIYTVQSDMLLGYDQEMNTVTEKQLSEEYTSFIKIGNSVLLLGYNSVDIEKI